MSSELLIAVWEAVRDTLPANKRADVAKDLLFAFADHGYEADDLAHIVDEDPDLSDAYDEVFPGVEDIEDDLEE